MMKRSFPSISVVMFPLLVALAGCMPGLPSGKMDVTSAEYSNLSGWEREDHPRLIKMLADECQRIDKLPAGTFLGGARTLPSGQHVEDWRNVCAALADVQNGDDAQARQFFETWFQPYLVVKGAFYTGYYDPEVPASLTKGGAYQIPLYRRPKDLLRGRNANGELEFGHWVNSVFRPYDDRAAIDGGSLEGRGLELAWLKSPLDLFLLQTQGSGRLRLQDGGEMFVGYDGRNGQPYVPIGRVLVHKGEMRAEDVNIKNIRAWLEAHPDQVKPVLEANPSYVFFRPVERKAEEGPMGAFGVPLTAGRSMAVDRRLIGYGMPIWADMSGKGRDGQAVIWAQMTFAQDTGSDIRGAGRGDLFLGWGQEAANIAGNMKDYGRMFVLVPRTSLTLAPNVPAGQATAGGGQTAK
ncbi:murein transglycosylase A [Bombella saccharophila]|uniref:peptidoglycan lytic exotransglycosylase n=1 Tax=Bombella saccharophila TaxID=2967338 RepID=A0ABT3W6J3_9PROT|nr:MltA domain-containing protein [Bombella saccharophila]MCX5613950.1 MltA domain-containing protein [Bombella saccharophila]